MGVPVREDGPASGMGTSSNSSSEEEGSGSDLAAPETGGSALHNYWIRSSTSSLAFPGRRRHVEASSPSATLSLRRKGREISEI